MNNKILQESADDSILQEDLDRISESDIPLEELKGKTVLVTGATGLIGSLLVKALQCCNRRKEAGIKILALVRNQEKAEKLFGELLKREDLKLVIGDITMPVEVDDKIDHIIHCASITTSKVMISRPVDVIRTSLNGTENLLELAKEKQVRSMVYVSSMEMYGALNLQNDQMVTEEMTGYLNPLALRSNYPESKRMCENMCVAYGTQYEVPVKIARLAQTFGAGVLSGENRVFAQFARSAMKGSDIVLHTEGKSEGNYCYTADAVRALLTILVKGENMQAYNVVNEKSHITIADMAKFVAEKIAEKPIEVVFDIPKENKFGYASDTKMHLAATRLMALGWQPETDLEESYRRLIASMKNRNV